ncbi:MAG: betaine-aldehyde dehydrogenase, partial [Pseudooceanicola nanhaiensis]
MKDWNAAATALYDGGFRPMFIDGQWSEARSGEVIEARNPADGTLLATVPRGTAADIDAAV